MQADALVCYGPRCDRAARQTGGRYCQRGLYGINVRMVIAIRAAGGKICLAGFVASLKRNPTGGSDRRRR
jgi:hypothetical protein